MRPAYLVAGLALILIIGLGAFLYVRNQKPPVPATVIPVEENKSPIYKIIGTSVQGRSIESFTYGTGSNHIVFVGGIHGGYEWNSILVAYHLKDYLDENPTAVPRNVRVTVILDANPDGVFAVVKKEGRFTTADVPIGDLSRGRFNADGVDLNRNFDCAWSPTGTWQNKTVSAGSAPFSEPEARALRDYALQEKPAAFIFWHSAAGGVYSSECGKGILPTTLDMMHTYAEASGYKPFEHFDAYVVHGASEDWLASVGIPAITVEMKTHETVEWQENLAGVLAVLNYFKKD